MAQHQIIPTTEVRDRYNVAAADLATTVDVLDRIASDATYPAMRSAEADAARARMYQDALSRFRDARAALDEAAGAPRELRRPVDVTERIEADL